MCLYKMCLTSHPPSPKCEGRRRRMARENKLCVEWLLLLFPISPSPPQHTHTHIKQDSAAARPSVQQAEVEALVTQPPLVAVGLAARRLVPLVVAAHRPLLSGVLPHRPPRAKAALARLLPLGSRHKEVGVSGRRPRPPLGVGWGEGPRRGLGQGRVSLVRRRLRPEDLAPRHLEGVGLVEGRQGVGLEEED